MYMYCTYYIPSPNQQKTIQPTDEVIMMKWWRNDDETYDESYEVVAVNVNTA